MTVKTLRTLLWFLLSICLIVSLILAFFFWQRGKILERLEERITYIRPAVVPVRLMILSKGESMVSARFRFFDADDREIGSFERSWRGTELSIDTILIPAGSRWLAFPSRVYTDSLLSSRGTELWSYYTRDGLPLIHDSASLSIRDRELLSDLFARLRSSSIVDDPPSAKGSWVKVVHDTRSLAALEVGVLYSLVVHSRGGIEVFRE